MQPALQNMCTFDSNDGGHVDVAQHRIAHDICFADCTANSLPVFLESMVSVLPAAMQTHMLYIPKLLCHNSHALH